MPPPPEFEALIRRWTGYVEAWAYRLDRAFPGLDAWPHGARALEKAAATYRPRGASFRTWLRRNLRNEVASALRTHRRRAARLDAIRDALRARARRAGRATPHPDGNPRIES